MTRLPERIRLRIRIAETGCWEWTGGGHRRGYGLVYWDGRTQGAHRVVYQMLVGEIDGETLDHLCRNRACVNPVHLEPTSNRVNILRGGGPTALNARKIECAQGHPLTGDNVYLRPGGRECRVCKKETKRAWDLAHTKRSTP